MKKAKAGALDPEFRVLRNLNQLVQETAARRRAMFEVKRNILRKLAQQMDGWRPLTS